MLLAWSCLLEAKNGLTRAKEPNRSSGEATWINLSLNQYFTRYLNLAADLLGGLKGGDLFVHVGLAPAAGSEVVHVDPLHDLLHRRALPVGEGGQ